MVKNIIIFRYLGTSVSFTFGDMAKMNLNSVVNEIRRDLQYHYLEVLRRQL